MNVCEGGSEKQGEIIYSVPIGPACKGQTAVYRRPSHVDGLFKVPQKIHNLGDLWAQKVQQYSNKPLLQNQNYQQIDMKAKKIGSWIWERGHRIFFLYMKNCPSWTTLDIASWIYGFVNIPLYDTLGDASLDYIMSITEAALIFTSKVEYGNLIKIVCGKTHNISDICFWDEGSPEMISQLTEMGFRVFGMSEILSANLSVGRPALSINHQLTYIFTSGTTGNPKGVVYTHKMVLTQLLSAEEQVKPETDEVHMSFLPIAHSFERCVNWMMINNAGNIKYARHPISQIMKDFQQIKPTRAVLVPRLLNRIYPTLKALYEQSKDYSHIKNMFGGRIRRVGTGSAPIASEIHHFFKEALDCIFSQGFGQTETTGACLRMEETDKKRGHVGGPTCAVEVKLVDVPEMNYYSTDLPPRGEICFRGDTIFTHYYKDPINTLETLDCEGWNHTGDIGMILPNGAFRIIDRKKNLFKLQQGEYISPQKVQNIYLQCPEVSEAFLHGDSHQNYSIVIVHPNLNKLVQIGSRLQILDKSVSSLCNNPKVQQYVLNVMNEHGKKAGLFGFEMGKKIKLWPNSFATLGMMTSTMKLKRHLGREIFKSVFERLYSS